MIRFLSAKEKQQVTLAWKLIATDLGLTYREADHPVLSGIWENHAVVVKIHKEPEGRVSQIMTGFEISHRHAFTTSFQLSRQGFMQSMIGMVGAKDIQIGDSSFDDKILVKGWDQEAVRGLLQNDQVRSTCLSIITHFRYTNVRITNQKISGSVAGTVMSTSEARTILHQFLKVALLLKEEGTRIDATSEEPINEENENIEARSHVLPEADTIAEPTIDSPVEKAVNDSAALVEKAALSHHGNLYLSEIAELLGKSEAEKQFSELFKNREIDWKLTISYIIPAGDSPVFGRDSGWIATINPGGIPGTKSLKIKYRIGQNRKEAIDRQAGSSLHIQGKLVELESSSNTLYIDSGDTREKANSHSATIVISI